MSTTETKVRHTQCASGDHCPDCFNAGYDAADARANKEKADMLEALEEALALINEYADELAGFEHPDRINVVVDRSRAAINKAGGN